MSILSKKYLGAASLMLQEMFDAVTPEEKQAMNHMFDNPGPELYERYRLEVDPDILSYLTATPEERADNPKWKDPEYKLKLHYFSFLHLQRGYLFMTRLSNIPNKNGIRLIPAFFSVLAEKVCSNKFKDSIFNDELTYEDY